MVFKRFFNCLTMHTSVIKLAEQGKLTCWGEVTWVARRVVVMIILLPLVIGGLDHDPSQQVDQASTQAIECLAYGGGSHSLIGREPGS